MESLNIHCAVEIFNDLGQLFVHFLNLLWADQPTQCPLCHHQQLHNPDQVTAYQSARVRHSHMNILQPFASLWTFVGWFSPRFQSLHKWFHLRPCLQKMKCTAIGPKGALASGCICFVPAGAKQLGITTASDVLIVSTNLKRDFGNTEHSLCDAVQLGGVNALQVPYGRTDLPKCNPKFNYLLYVLLCWSFH